MASSNKYEQEIDEAKDLVISAIGETMDLYGINRSVGNLYGTMVFEDSMTLDQMREELQMSKPSMSTGVKKLQEYDLVKQQFTRGSRKQHFVAEKDFFLFFRNFFNIKFNREITVNMESLKESEEIIKKILEADDVDPETREHAEKVYAQLEHSTVYYKWLSQISDAIQSGEIFKYFPIPEE
ncbi:putative transcriptional regulator of cud operon [Staphylococcus piscifermentans]|uniref:HTH-type transcriptional regulator n=1 Tax=Staphylococcus piscifermentans TaxID=70258 RepID=A0A239TJH8_9STAP|nr:GbsR/MarR family transcriptional regulator [Staphylococcus piscifermentans]RTX85716.1 GbsR/MarR family transcriptional regulator [Staphylococcus piscifermentans]GEP84511.1 GbsR/MarR family transcriptional regulator [Staphylococcus piscifermentans]SNU97745.1 putative transcriptional regulator of cud operon [Staphylococcus piscifermentans]